MSLAATTSRVAVRLPSFSRCFRKSSPGRSVATATRASSAETREDTAVETQRASAPARTSAAALRRRPFRSLGLMPSLLSPFGGALASPLSDMEYEMNRMVNEFDTMRDMMFGHRDTVGRLPDKLDFNCDVLEKKGEFQITADLPGLAKDQVNITVDDDRRLHITAERAARHEEVRDHGTFLVHEIHPDVPEVGEPDEDVKMHVYERTYGKIERMFRLPDNAEDEKIEASMKNGVLTVHIPKAPEEAKEEIPERTIKIK